MIAEVFENAVVDVGLDFETHGGSPAKITQLFFNFLEEVFCFFLIDVEVAVAGDAERIGSKYFVAGKEFTGA